MRTPNIDYVGNRRRWILISGGLVVLSLFALVFLRLDLSIDFVGGSSFLVEGIEDPDVSGGELSDAARDAGATDVTAQITTDGGVPTGAIVRTAPIELGSPTQEAVVTALRETAQADDVQFTFVGPTWGEQISRKALEALIVFLGVVVLYISLRLEFKMAVAAVLALVHDLFITVGLYALVGFTVSPSTVIALLTILGYSLYDSVVIFDRVEENVQGIGGPGRRTYGEAVNTSMNEVLWRSVNTSLTSLLPVGALLFLGAQLLGATTLQDLALALFIGMFLGAYSSIFVAAPFLAWWKEKEPEYAELRRKVGARVASGQEPAEVSADAAAASRAPITTEYVRGRGRRKRK